MTETKPERATYTADELASMLGVHPQSLRKAVRAGEVPAPQRIGARLLWLRAVVDAWLSGRTVGTMGGVTLQTAADARGVCTAALR